jgi:hypothetical protein
VNGSSGGASSIYKIADEAGKPFGLVGNTVGMYLRECIKQGNMQQSCCYLSAVSGVVRWAREFVLARERRRTSIKARRCIWRKSQVRVTARDVITLVE